MRIEIHVLQNFAPSNLNRDDTGSPKDAEFGGYRRARISSQCLKQAIRKQSTLREVAGETFARRSNMHARQVAQILADDPHYPKPFAEAYSVGRYIFQKMGFKEKKERLTVMLFLGGDEIKKIAETAAKNWELLSPLSNANLLRERFARQLAGYLAGLGDDAEMVGRLIVNHRARSANASALQSWLELDEKRWASTFAAVREMTPELLAKLREHYEAEVEIADDEEEQDEGSIVPDAAARLFNDKKKNKNVLDELKKVDVKSEHGRADAPIDKKTKAIHGYLKTIVAPLKKLRTKAVDVALFGRMIAEIKDGAMNVDAACQVAHAISTNRLAVETDYFTAVEELKDLAQKQGIGQDAGAGMIGTMDFNSACFYRYANLDLGQLRDNLHHDDELVGKTADAFLRAFIHAVPTGMQNSFAAHSPPSLIFAVVRSGPPMSLVNAFVKPVAPHGNESLVERSIVELDRYYGQVVRVFGDGGLKKAAVCQVEAAVLAHLKGDVGSVENLIDVITAAAFESKETK